MAYIGKQPVVGNFVKLDAITTSATATFNLTNGGVAYFPQTANNCIVSLNGVIQSPTSAYTISGSTIVFSDALTASDSIDFILVLGDVLSIGTPSDGTVTSAKLASGTAGLIAWQSVQTTGFTAVAGRGYPCNTTSAAFTVTLPASPSAGDTIILLDYAGTFDTNKITLGRNGNKIEGATSDKQLSTERKAVQLVYIDATQGWLVSSAANETATAIEPLSYSVDFLVIAGGGGGGSRYYGGGGGAGGYRTSTQTVTAGTVITVTVGDGGAGGTQPNRGTNGSNSSISGSGLTTITSAGGGGGATHSTDFAASSGGSGGGGCTSGGGGTETGASGNTPSTSPSQGNKGGDTPNPYDAGAGGGGAGAVGGNSIITQTGGQGGAGTASSITGSSVTRSGGGGGAGNSTGGAGGTGGGGAGSNATGTAGTANTGGGGGGTERDGVDLNGASGGKGVVILSVPTASYSSTTTGSPTVTTSGSNTILQFNGSGSYTA
jgi:hypothetical protein